MEIDGYICGIVSHQSSVRSFQLEIKLPFLQPLPLRSPSGEHIVEMGVLPSIIAARRNDRDARVVDGAGGVFDAERDLGPGSNVDQPRGRRLRSHGELLIRVDEGSTGQDGDVVRRSSSAELRARKKT